jgi:hypothetical protein
MNTRVLILSRYGPLGASGCVACASHHRYGAHRGRLHRGTPFSRECGESFLRGDSSVAVCGIALVDKSGNVARTCARKATAWNMSLHALGLDRLLPTLMRSYVMTDWDHAETRSVEHVIGASYLIRRSIFEAVGGFDERFFMYLEDLDLSCRIRQAGWKCLYLAGTRAFHEGGGSSKKVLSQRLFYSLRSRLQYASKHFDPIGCIALSAITLMLEPFLRCGTSLARGDIQSLPHTFQGYRLLYSWCIGPARKSGSCLSARP